jgi:hypothetical protein
MATWLTHPIILLVAGLPLICSAASKNGFKLDGALIPADQIVSGGPPRDGIPSLEEPEFVAAKKAGFLDDRDRVLGLALNGIARAYPIRILNYHEIVNDKLGNDRVVITYCPLCGSGMAFKATLDGRRFEFGVSGLLYNSDVLLYDRQTGSLWSQLKAQAVTGRMRGTRLTPLALSHTTWADWKRRHPDSEVLTTDTGYLRSYRMDPYPNYSRSGRLYFPVAESNSAYRRKEPVMGLEINERFKAYPFAELAAGPERFTDEFQGQRFEVVFDAKHQTARIIAADGIEIPTTIAFWFAWYAFHPDTAIYR